MAQLDAQPCHANRRHVWTNLEVKALSTMVRANASNAELLAAFPNLRLNQINGKMRNLRLPRRRPTLSPFHDPALNAVRLRAIESGLSLRELDRITKAGRYFQNSTRRVVLRHVARATHVLGGKLVFEWEEA